MRKKITGFLLFALVFFCIGYFFAEFISIYKQTNIEDPSFEKNEISQSVAEKIIADKKQDLDIVKEDFFDFFNNFSSNQAFQKERIIFPLEYYSWKEGKLVKTKLKEKDWQYIDFYSDNNKVDTDRYLFQTYDSFDKIATADNDKRIVIMTGTNNGINIIFYFLRINGKWQLTKCEDLSN